MLKKISLVVLSTLLAASASARINLDSVREASRSRDLVTLAKISEQSVGDPLEMYPRYYYLTTQINQTDENDANNFINRYSPSPLAEKFLAEWLKELARRQNWSQYEALYSKVDSPNTELICLKQQAALNRGDSAGIANHKNLWYSAKALPSACNPLFDALFERGILKDDDIWWRIRQALANNQTDLARQLASRVGSSEYLVPKPPVVVKKGKKTTTIQTANLNTVNAAPERWINDIDTSTRAGRELWLFAVEKIGRSNPNQAARLISEQNHLNAADQQFAWQQLGLSAARRLVPEASSWIAKGNTNDLNEEERAWGIRAALRIGDWKTVEQRINALPAAEQQDNAWRYWKGRALLAQNNGAAANALWLSLSEDIDFYGLLAREELGAILSAPTPAYKASNDDVKAMQTLPGIQRALELSSQGWRVEANREWNWAMKGLSDQQLLAAAELASRYQIYDRSIYSAMRPKTLHDFSLRFPMPFRDHVEPAAKANGLDPAWVFGLIRQESRFVPDIRSSAGATGLMQLMPATAKWVAKKMSMSDFTMNDMSDPAINPQLGSYYLAYWNERFGGNPVLATAGYNAGPGNAAKWRGERDLEAAVYIETIPFNETRDYVKAVLTNATHYAHNFSNSPTQLMKRLPAVTGRSTNVEVSEQ
ncbi:lytic transglycosylase domain-containing protein [Chitinibacter bivalviorum]|uniref:Lytic transglycosylase domain-containing protein n=1 Tax=Chitinibacter bivalviorum TaxID=2739434 RepID=A0A7H9BMI5_9NEIS|nr:lytic transglycosylase domain-containing protein [Chitinibacter bivalviorum]QLG89606.1 lytic transglycosylase domain-containing protein [Chitinibacter bivalviorum]